MRGTGIELSVHELVKAENLKSEAVPLALLHGFTGDSTTWSRLLPHLGNCRRILGIDLVGHGESPRPSDPSHYTMPASVAQIAAALERHGVRRAHWLGYSMGGRMVLNLALGAPAMVASAVLIGATPGLADQDERLARIEADAALGSFVGEHGIEAFVDRWMANPLFRSQERLGPEYIAVARAQRLSNDPRALSASLRGMGTGAMEPLWDRLGEIDSPVLLVAGALDTKFSRLAERLSGAMPDARLLIVPEAGHAVHLETPELLGREVRKFLAESDAG